MKANSKSYAAAALSLIILPYLLACHDKMISTHNPGGAQGEHAEKIRQEISKARTQLANRNYEEALKTADTAMRLDPGEHMAFLCHGYALFKLNKAKVAIKDFDEAVRLAPEDYQSFEYRAAAYQWIKRFRKAIADYKQAISVAPADGAVQSKLNKELGYCYLSFGQLLDAKDCLTRALKLSPDESKLSAQPPIKLDTDKATIYASLATAELHLHEAQNSLRDASKAIQIDPSNGEAYQVRSRAYGILGQVVLAKNDELSARKLFASKIEDSAQNR